MASRSTALRLLIVPALALAVCGCTGARSSPRETGAAARVLVIGLDGFTWDLARPWMAEGRLPNLSRLAAEGASGTLASVEPASSPPAWTSAVTGVNPGKHGIFGFLHTPADGSSPGFVSSANRRYAPIWKLLSRAGRRVGIINVPVSSPPDPVNGFMVGGFPHADREGIAWPLDTLADFPGYRSDSFVEPPTPGQEDAWLQQLYETSNARLHFALSQLERGGWDLFFVVFTGPDRISHQFWHHMDAQHPQHDPALAARHGNAIRDFYVAMDSAVGRLWRAAGDGGLTMVLSDHGFGPAYQSISSGRLMSALNPGLAAGTRPPVYLHDFFSGQIRIARDGASPPDAVADHRYRRRRARTSHLLLDLEDPGTGTPLIQQVHTREELYHGEALAEAPDLIFRETPGYLVLHAAGQSELVGPLPGDAFTGFHRSNGILVLHGPGIRRGAALAAASILDVTPTLLHLLAQPVPTYMDGQVLSEAMDPAHLARSPIRSVVLENARYLEHRGQRGVPEAEAKEQLRALGYLR